MDSNGRGGVHRDIKGEWLYGGYEKMLVLQKAAPFAVLPRLSPFRLRVA